ncbi:aminopeptidase [Xanthoria calcicola]
MRYGICALLRHWSSTPRTGTWTGGLRPTALPVSSRPGPLQSRLYAAVSAADLQFGQPVALEYAQRRTKLASKLPENGIAILAASDVKYRSGAVFYDFHQDSDFFYLTGFNEPEAVAVIGKSTASDDHSFQLYVRAKDPKAEQWEGSRSGVQAALDVFNADESGDIKDIGKQLSRIISDASEIFTDASPPRSSASAFSRLFASKTPPDVQGLATLLDQKSVKSLRSVLNEIRNIKSDAEISNMRKAGQASGRAFTKAMRQAWTAEKDLTAFLEYRFKRNGCDTSAYVPVVAGGKNASQIHYVRNDDVLLEGDLVLADAGGEYGNYITDITRTWPISGTFTAPQKDLYNAILATQRTCIALCRADASNSLDKIHQIAEASLKDSLARLGFDMSGNALETLFPHHLGHYIGLDVHDTPGQSRKHPLQVGQCVTVEPGIYVPDTDRWPAAFRGMGIRIEDSVCVQEEHPLVLSTEAVKEVDDIEALRA